MKTQITVKRTDGTVEVVERPGHITSEADRAKFTAMTKAAGKGDIIGWELVTVKRAPVQARCRYYTRDQGCPMHGETCRS